LAKNRQGKHIITTPFEHAAVSAPIEWLQKQGYEVTEIPVDEKGNILLEKLSEAIREDTILVSTMMVNNEMGAVLPVEEIKCPDNFPCRCHSGLWKVPDLSEKMEH